MSAKNQIFSVNEDILQRFKKSCVEKDLKMSTFLNKILEDYLNKEEKEDKKPKTNIEIYISHDFQKIWEELRMRVPGVPYIGLLFQEYLDTIQYDESIRKTSRIPGEVLKHRVNVMEAHFKDIGIPIEQDFAAYLCKDFVDRVLKLL